MMSAPSRLLSLSTAVPPFRLGQVEIRDFVTTVFPERAEEVERMLPVFENAGIDTRYSCVPLEWYAHDHDWREKNDLYLRHSVELTSRAATAAIADADLTTGDIDAIVAVSTTGVATPSLDALLIDRLALRRDVIRLPLFGLGCCGGVIGLSRASGLARASANSRVLFVVVELCGLTFRRSDYSKSNIIATALFGDGAAAGVIGPGDAAPVFGEGGEYTWPGTLDVMGWRVEDDGLGVLFSRDIPKLVENDFRDALDNFLYRNDRTASDYDGFLCHPGGAKVIDALEDVFDRGRDSLDDSRNVLRKYGNMSAATVLFVLRAAIDRGAQGRYLMSALGPGFTAGFQEIDL